MPRLPYVATGMLLVVLSAPRAEASTFTLASYPIGVHQAEPGLVLFSVDLLPEPYTFALNGIGDSTTVPLFLLGTLEPALNLDDLQPYLIGVAFIFSDPPPPFGGVAFGITGALRLLAVDFGYVRWGPPALLPFGNGGLLGIALEDTEFLLPGATAVDATFTLLNESEAVPEPSTLILVGLGLVAVRARARRRRAHPAA